MRSRMIIPFFAAFASCVVLCAPAAQAHDAAKASTMNNSSTTSAEQRQAADMVPASAVLSQEIDARKVHSGEQFRAQLTQGVYLKDGAMLPKGTELIGTIDKDAMSPEGTSTLALRFTTADTKSGKMVPIVATIVGMSPPDYSTNWDSGYSAPSPWDGTSLSFDQIKAASGFDMHSRIAGTNSGVFESTKKDELRLSDQCQLALAIGPQSAGEMNGGA